jgi:predicted dehydrogenase
MTNIALVGVGEWGRNLARNFASIPGSSLVALHDINSKTLEQVAKQFPSARATGDIDAILSDEQVEAVVVASTAKTHFELAAKSMRAGKHVFVEKPLALTEAHARELVELSEQTGRILMVGHLLFYHPAVERLKKLIDAGEIGRILYIYSQRVNLGKIRRDESALWSLAPHDFAVILYLLGEEPATIVARGQHYIQGQVEDVVFVNCQFPNRAMANVHLSWLDPHKIRKFTIVGDRKMVVFDDMEATEKLKIYDKGASAAPSYDSYGEAVSLRFGDIFIPQLKMTEPLRNECAHFIECVRDRKKPLSDGANGLKVVRMLEAAQRSLEGGGIPVSVL